MKNIFNRIVTVILLLSVLASLVCHANAAQAVTSFSDVPPSYWGYQTIMYMTDNGIFKGKTTPVNGVGSFFPEETMTRAEFITAALRALYPRAAGGIDTQGLNWWKGFYVLALDKKILKPYELDNCDLSKPMRREEMAMVMVRCVENMGEKPEGRVAASQIADYERVSEYYKEYVRTCFSYGLLCGVDYKGTFMPSKTLTRAEAATVLCRLIDKNMRIDVEYLEDPEEDRWNPSYETEDENRFEPDKEETKKPIENDKPNTNDKVEEETKKPEKEEQKPPVETEKQEENKPELMPWEYPGAKQPHEYTAEEYEALTTIQKEAFVETFEDADEFNDWMNLVTGNTGSDETEKMPWENGGKQPEEYTWAEYEALTPSQKEAFVDSFENPEDFEKWHNRVNGEFDSVEAERMPWENGGKQPKDYTWAEYEALTPLQKEKFFDSFESAADFDNWQNRANGNTNSPEAEKMPWENGGKQPEDYTWAEYEALTPVQKEAFFDSFESTSAFDTWMNNAKGNTESDKTDKMPWENGGKQPKDYTWAEYEALTPAQKEAFFDSFDNASGFDAWMNSAKGNSESVETDKMPWENGGKQPKDYTWAEYVALTPLQKEAFFDRFESPAAFDAWMNKVKDNTGSAETDKMPWENGGKLPKDYTWSEYEALTPLQKEAFFDSFEDSADFDAWLDANQP